MKKLYINGDTLDNRLFNMMSLSIKDKINLKIITIEKQ